VIGWLHGQVLHHHKDGAIVLDVHDVGYEVSVASQEDYRVGDIVDLYVFTAVRDDAIVLYGFPSYLDASSSNSCWSRRASVPRPPSRPFARCQPVTSPRRIERDDARRSRRFRASDPRPRVASCWN